MVRAHRKVRSRRRRLILPSLAAGTLAGALVTVTLGTAAATASVKALYAYAGGSATAPSSCPSSTTASDECTLTQALSLAPSGALVLLATPGSVSAYVGNFTISSSVTLAPAAGVANPTIQGYGCSSCGGATLDVPATSGGTPVTATLEELTVGANFTYDVDSAGIDVGGTVDLEDVTVANSSTEGQGGGAYVAPGGTLTVVRSLFTNDHSGVVMSNGSGGAIYNAGTLTLMGSTFSDDQNGFGTGGAIYNDTGATGTVVGTTFTDVTSELGGAVDNAGTFTIIRSTFTGTLANGDGGAIDNSGTLTVKKSTFAGDAAIDRGGAIENDGLLTVIKSTFSNDVTTDTGGTGDDGGAIDNEATLVVSESTFAGNSAGDGPSYDGAALENGENGDGGSATLLDSTFAGNLGQNSIDNATGTVTIAGGVLDDSSSSECAGAIADDGFNLEDDPAATCGFTAAAHDLVGVDPALGPLQDNGGFTDTLQPGSSSPVLDEIPNPTVVTIGSSRYTLCPGWDQRDVSAPAFLYGCAMGSVDVADTSAPIMRSVSPSSGSAGGDNSVTIRGVNFPTEPNGVTAVDFGGVPAESFRVVSSHVIVAVAPAGTAGTTVPVTVNVVWLWRPKDEYTYS